MLIRERQGDPKLIAGAANNLALSHQELGNYSQALEYHFRSLKLKEELGDSARIRISYNNIGLIYENLGDFPTARNYYQKALNLRPLKVDSTTYLTNLYNIGVTYFKEDRNDSAKFYFVQGMPIAQILGDQRMIGLHHLHFGVIQQRIGEYENAKDRISLALRDFEALGKQDQIIASWTHLGINYLKTGKPGQAKEYCEKAWKKAQETEDLNKQVDCLSCLEQSYRALGKNQKAYTFLAQYHSLKDSLSSTGIHKQIVRRDLEFGFKKQKLSDSLETARTNSLVQFGLENKIKRQKTFFYFLVTFGVLLVAFLLLLVFNLRQKKRHNQLLEARVKLRTKELEKQNTQLADYAFINAHLLRQPLAQIMGLIPLIKECENEEERDQYIHMLMIASQKLDGVIHEIRDVVEKIPAEERTKTTSSFLG